MNIKRTMLYMIIIGSMLCLFSMVSFAEIRTYITVDEFNIVKDYKKGHDDRVYDNFNENNISLYWSKNLDSQYRQGIFSDGYYNDSSGRFYLHLFYVPGYAISIYILVWVEFSLHLDFREQNSLCTKLKTLNKTYKTQSAV